MMVLHHAGMAGVIINFWPVEFLWLYTIYHHPCFLTFHHFQNVDSIKLATHYTVWTTTTREHIYQCHRWFSTPTNFPMILVHVHVPCAHDLIAIVYLHCRACYKCNKVQIINCLSAIIILISLESQQLTISFSHWRKKQGGWGGGGVGEGGHL